MKNPFKTSDYKVSIRLNYNCNISYRDIRCSLLLKELLMKMTQRKPEFRIDAITAYRSKALANLKLCSTVFDKSKAEYGLRDNRNSFVIKRTDSSKLLLPSSRNKENKREVTPTSIRQTKIRIMSVTSKDTVNENRRSVVLIPRKEGKENSMANKENMKDKFFRTARYKAPSFNQNIQNKARNMTLLTKLNKFRGLNVYTNRTTSGMTKDIDLEFKPMGKSLLRKNFSYRQRKGYQ